jgi:hypothetical protein
MANDKKYISKIVKGSDTLWLKDAEARVSIEDIYSKISGGLHYLGKSTTPIADGDATGPWVIDGVTYVVSNPAEGQKALSAGLACLLPSLPSFPVWSSPHHFRAQQC